MKLVAVLFVVLSTPVLAETVVATRTIRAQDVISVEDVRLDPAQLEGAYSDIADVLGKEAKYAIYPGRAIMRGAVGQPALIERNQFVELIYQSNGLRIVTDGRALDRGAAGDRIRVMNVDSRTTLFGTITPQGAILVSN